MFRRPEQTTLHPSDYLLTRISFPNVCWEKMDRMQILTVIRSVMKMMMIMMMLLLHLALTDQSLECHNDFYNTFTCVWNISKLDIQPPITPHTNCSLRVDFIKAQSITTKEQQMSVVSSELNIRMASVEFEETGGIIISAANIHQKVTCENYDKPVAQTQLHKVRDSVVKVLPPVGVTVDGLNVSWSFGSPLKTFPLGREFELQYRSVDHTWTDVESLKVREPHVAFQEDSLILDQQYVLRLRAKLSKHNAVWSDWSREYNWMSEVGKPRPPTANGEFVELKGSSLLIWITLTGITLATVSIFTVLFKCNKSKWLQKIHSSHIPDPSKYFSDLNSQHKGHFVSWLGLTFALDRFITLDSECVSPVEVVKLQNASDSRHVDGRLDTLRDEWENTSKTSNFSNSTYFLSQSSKGPMDILEPCSAHCSYGPARGTSDPEDALQNGADVTCGEEDKDETSELECSLKRLEKLRQDTQSPDSGFATGAEDSMEETDLPSPLGLNLPPHPLLGLPAPHPNKHLFLTWDQTPLVVGLKCLKPGLDLDLKLFSSCGMIEPSSGDYMPVKNVQN